jgi:predicted neuraminidase
LLEAQPGHFLAAWFGGTHEGHLDVAIWLSRFDGSTWSTPARVADEPGVPLWNPVLFRDAEGIIWLFYKAGSTVPTWSGLCIQSCDDGHTWSAPVLLPAGLLGPAKNKPITLSNGHILCGASVETWRNWAAWAEISADGGRAWTRHGPIVAPGYGLVGQDDLVSATWDVATGRLRLPQDFPGVIQPAVWEYAPGRLKMLLRATQRVGVVCAATSDDYGRTWTAARPTTLPNSNSGLDAVRLTDGRIVLACNPVADGRTPLALLVSADNGETWGRRVDLETGPGEYSYPSIIQAADGRIHIVYTHCRTHIQHVELAPDDLR